MAVHIILAAMAVAFAALCMAYARLSRENRRQAAWVEQQIHDEQIVTKRLVDNVATLNTGYRALKSTVDAMSDAVLPDDSLARKAKEEIDKFNAGIHNILTYNGPTYDQTRNTP